MTAAERLEGLGAFIAQNEGFWRPRPFVGDALPWASEFPALAAWAKALPEADVERLQEGNLDSGGVPDVLRALAREARNLCDVPISSTPSPRLTRRPRRVRGRKWEQVRRFGDAALSLPRPTRWVEWCAGKSHLGRAVSEVSGVGLTALERDPALCEAGRRTGDHDIRYVAIDVHDPNVLDWIPPGSALLGLHACGDLSDALVRASVARNVSLLAAPCCPHRNPGEYRPMSTVGAAQSLGLDRPALLLAVAGEHVGSGRELRLRRRGLTWRTAFSSLVGDGYYSLPSVPDSELAGSFANFAARWANREGLTLPNTFDEEAVLRSAADHVRGTRALGLVRAPFRAALELWTVLDRAAWLEEMGREVHVSRFCPATVTPRNLLLRSEA